MPACQTTDLLQTVWDLLEAGDETNARRIFNRVLPLISYERQYGVALYKEVMYRRGVISNRVGRAPGRELDEWDRLEVDAIMADVAPHEGVRAMNGENQPVPGRLRGRVAVITGSTGGLGEGIAERLAAEGCAVMISGRRSAEGEAVAAKHPADRRGGGVRARRRGRGGGLHRADCRDPKPLGPWWISWLTTRRRLHRNRLKARMPRCGVRFSTLTCAARGCAARHPSLSCADRAAGASSTSARPCHGAGGLTGWPTHVRRALCTR